MRDNPMQAFDAETRQAINAAFDAMSKWRDDMTASNERYAETVFDKMAAAARAIGWPDGLIEASRQQLHQAAKVQSHLIDQMMDAWQQQLNEPGKIPTPAEFMSRFQAGAGSNPFQAMMPPQMSGMMGGGAMNPMQFWMQAADMWQKSWSSALETWSNSTDVANRFDKRR